MISVRPKQASQAKASDVPMFAPRTKGSRRVQHEGVPASRTKGGWQVEYEGVPQALDTNGELFNAHGVVNAWSFTSRQEAAAARNLSCRSQHHCLNHYRIVTKVH